MVYPELKLAGYNHGYFWNDEEAAVERIRASGAQRLFVAITSPKKESFINKWRDRLGVTFVMGVGGTFDVVAGKVQRAHVEALLGYQFSVCLIVAARKASV